MNIKNIKLVVEWIISLFLAYVFIKSGLPKIQGSPEMAAAFAHWGYPDWFLYFIGAMEMLGGFLVLVPGFRVYAASLLTMVMLGAFLTHAFASEWAHTSSSIKFLVLSLVLAGFRWNTLPFRIKSQAKEIPEN